MAEQEIINLGIVGISNKGQYNSETDYERLNVVTYNGSSYCASQSCKGIIPTNTDYWQLYAEKGETGETGPQGPAPVKGVDYYTLADKTEIENDLSASIHQEVSEQVGSLVSATPLAASSVSDMTDTTRIYVNTTDGNWYYYDGSEWVVGGVYQSTSIGDNSIDYNHIKNNIKSTIGIKVPQLTLHSGYVNGSAIISSTAFKYTSPFLLRANETIYFFAKGYNTTVNIISSCDENGNNIKRLVKSTDSNYNLYTYTTSHDIYVILCSENDYFTYYYIDQNIKVLTLDNYDKINELIEIPKGTITDNYYIKNNGNVKSHNYGAYSITDYIEISPNTKYVLKNINWNIDDNVGYAFYNKNKIFLSYTRNTENDDYYYTSPDEAYYVRHTLLTKYKNDTKLYINNTFNELKREIELIKSDISGYNMFNSFVKFGVIGDSLASGESVAISDGTAHYIDNYDYSWGQFIARKYGMSCINFSAGGLNTRTWLTSQLNKLRNQDNKCNAYIIGLGVNDYALGSSYIGTTSDINILDFTQNADTFYGNYGRIIGNIKDIQPKAKIFMFTIPDQTPEPNRDYNDLNTAIRTISTLFDNVYLIDLANDYNEYYTTGFIYSNMRVGHYNAIGYNYMAELLYKWISEYMLDNYQNFKQIEFIGTNHEY